MKAQTSEVFCGSKRAGWVLDLHILCVYTNYSAVVFLCVSSSDQFMCESQTKEFVSEHQRAV